MEVTTYPARKRVRAPPTYGKKKKQNTTSTGSSSYALRVPTRNSASFAGAGFPLRLNMKHRFTFTNERVFGNTLQTMKVGCISLFAPSVDTARQPMFFDQMTAIYSRYNVIGAKCVWTIVPALITAESPAKWCAWINENNAVTGTTFDDLVEYRGAQVFYSQGGVNPDRIVITQTYSTKSHNTGSVMANPELAGTSISNPLEQPQFQLNFLKLANAATPTPSYFISYTVEYSVVWSELKEINGS